MREEQTGSAGGLKPALTRVAAALGAGVLFNLVCFGFLHRSESILSYGAVRTLTRIVWWPVAVTCGAAPRDLFCALPGVVFGFLFHWLVAFVLLWRYGQPGPRGVTRR